METFGRHAMFFVLPKEISHAFDEGAFHSILLFCFTALFYPEPTESSDTFSLEKNLTGATDKGETLSNVTVSD